MIQTHVEGYRTHPLLLRESARPVPAPCKDGDAGVAVGEAVPRSYTMGRSWRAAAHARPQPKAVRSCDALRRRREAELRGPGYERDRLRLNRRWGATHKGSSRTPVLPSRFTLHARPRAGGRGKVPGPLTRMSTSSSFA